MLEDIQPELMRERRKPIATGGERMISPVTDNGIRPAGKQDECFYCGVHIGEPHQRDCVLRKRTVVLEMKIQYVVEVPSFWDKASIEFHRNDSSFCSGNDVELIAKQAAAAGEHVCNTCARTEVTFVREATEEDMEEMGFNAEMKLRES